MSEYIIAETGEFPAQYNVLKKGDDGIFIPIFGPDPDLDDAKRKYNELANAGKRARTKSGHFKSDDPSTPDVNEAYVGGKKKAKKKAAKKKTAKKK